MVDTADVFEVADLARILWLYSHRERQHWSKNTRSCLFWYCGLSVASWENTVCRQFSQPYICHLNWILVSNRVKLWIYINDAIYQPQKAIEACRFHRKGRIHILCFNFLRIENTHSLHTWQWMGLIRNNTNVYILWYNVKLWRYILILYSKFST